jgi:hypothetical protein
MKKRARTSADATESPADATRRLARDLEDERANRKRSDNDASMLRAQVQQLREQNERVSLRLDACLFAMVLMQAQVRARRAFEFIEKKGAWEGVVKPGDDVSLAR